MGTLGATETEGTELSQLVASDVHEQKPITVASGAGELQRGTVLGMVSGDYEYNILNPGGSDGTEVARAILLEDVDATSAAVKTQGYFAGKYRLSDLVWPGGITDAQKNAALLGLQDKGILVDQDFV
jgi:hypothetical protein